MKRAEPVSGANIKAGQGDTKSPTSRKDEDVKEFRLLVDRPKAGDLVPGPADPGVMAGSFANILGQAARENFSGEVTEPSAIPDVLSAAGTGVNAGPAVVNAEVAVETPDAGNRRCEEIVERILVAQSSADGSAEIRIRLDRSWLPDTEVRLLRPPDGSLDVEFMSEQVESQRFLMPNLSDLRERLGNRTGVPVTVRMSEHADSGTGDGRSRNRRSIYEEMGEK